MMTPPELPSSVSATRGPVSGWMRVLSALGIGVLAMLVGSAAGALTLGLIGILFEGAKMLRVIPAFVFYGVLFGPVLAWPATLVMLPAIWLYYPLRHRRVALLVGGALTGTATLIGRVLLEAGLGPLGWTMVAAGTVGGLAAGAVFGAFVPRSGSGTRERSSLSS